MKLQGQVPGHSYGLSIYATFSPMLPKIPGAAYVLGLNPHSSLFRMHAMSTPWCNDVCGCVQSLFGTRDGTRVLSFAR